MLRDPNSARMSIVNMMEHEKDDLLGEPRTNNNRALPLILVGFGLIAAWAAYLFFFQ